MKSNFCDIVFEYIIKPLIEHSKKGFSKMPKRIIPWLCALGTIASGECFNPLAWIPIGFGFFILSLFYGGDD